MEILSLYGLTNEVSFIETIPDRLHTYVKSCLSDYKLCHVTTRYWKWVDIFSIFTMIKYKDDISGCYKGLFFSFIEDSVLFKILLFSLDDNRFLLIMQSYKNYTYTPYNNRNDFECLFVINNENSISLKIDSDEFLNLIRNPKKFTNAILKLKNNV